MDFEIIKEANIRASNTLRNLISLEEISSEYHIHDIDDPSLYAIYKKVNENKLTQNEIMIINDTIQMLIKKQQKINDYNLSVCVNEYTHY
jgi:hypothetical protein